MTTDELIRFTDVARAAGVHPRTLERWAAAGKIPGPKKLKVNGRRVYSASERDIILRFAREVDST